jgi:hypothetical protein
MGACDCVLAQIHFLVLITRGLKRNQNTSILPEVNMHSDTRTREQRLRDLVADGIAIAPRFQPEPTYKHTGRGSYRSETVSDIAAAKRQSSRKK